MRRHYSNYFKGIDHFKDYRMQLVGAGSHESVMEILEAIITDPRYLESEVLSLES